MAFQVLDSAGKIKTSVVVMDAGDITSGILPDARMPNLTGDVTTVEGAVGTTLANIPAISGANLTTLNAGNVSSGTLPLARLVDVSNAQIAAAAAIDWTKISKAGSSLADLITRSASDLSSGELPDARLSANVVLKNAANSFTLINPLTTIAESWIGPSSTTGIYFKDGNVGIGTTTPGSYKLALVDATNDTSFSFATGATAGSMLVANAAINVYKSGILGASEWHFRVGGTDKALLDTAGLTVYGLINTKNYTVATLPAGTRGDIAYVTDALAPEFLVAVAGGGAIVTPVFRNATVWVAF